VAEKIAVVYFSQTGNTERVAQAIGRGLEQSGATADLMRIEKTDAAALKGYDLFGIGAPVFYFRLPFNVEWFIKGLRGMEGKSAFLFLTEGGHAANTFRQAQKLLARKGVTLVDTFKCLGYDTYPPLVGLNRQLGHPDASELSSAEAFARGLVQRRDAIRKGAQELIPAFPREKGEFARLGRILSRPVVAMISPRKRVNAAKCTRCAACVRECPTNNIRLAFLPKFAWRCVYCYRCASVCPVSAIECNWNAMKRRMKKNYPEIT
jgi:flavodoxin/ferredoxin